jgi:hypothetical protein
MQAQDKHRRGANYEKNMQKASMEKKNRSKKKRKWKG